MAKIQYKPISLNLSFPRGDTFSFTAHLKDANGNTLILTANDKLFLTVKEKNSDTVKFQLTIDNGIEYSNERYVFTFADTDTDSLLFKEYNYDIELVTTERHRTLVVGILTLTTEVTYKADEVA